MKNKHMTEEEVKKELGVQDFRSITKDKLM